MFYFGELLFVALRPDLDLDGVGGVRNHTAHVDPSADSSGIVLAPGGFPGNLDDSEVGDVLGAVTNDGEDMLDFFKACGVFVHGTYMNPEVRPRTADRHGQGSILGNGLCESALVVGGSFEVSEVPAKASKPPLAHVVPLRHAGRVGVMNSPFKGEDREYSVKRHRGCHRVEQRQRGSSGLEN